MHVRIINLGAGEDQHKLATFDFDELMLDPCEWVWQSKLVTAQTCKLTRSMEKKTQKGGQSRITKILSYFFFPIIISFAAGTWGGDDYNLSTCHPPTTSFSPSSRLQLIFTINLSNVHTMLLSTSSIKDILVINSHNWRYQVLRS